MAAPLRRLARPRTIACIGRNYADHILELGSRRPREPFYFLKPATSILQPSAAAEVLCPRGARLHYEVELAAVIGTTVDEAVESDDAVRAAVKGWAVAIDMTARKCPSPLPTLRKKWLTRAREGRNSPERRKEEGTPVVACEGLQDVPARVALDPCGQHPRPPRRPPVPARQRRDQAGRLHEPDAVPHPATAPPRH